MSGLDVDALRQVKTLPSLVKLLRDELDWPIEHDDIDEITFDFEPDELGLDAKHAAKIKEIKQFRPLDTNQPWGIFWVNFEKKRLPMVVMRRILGNLVIKRRATARKADRPGWHLNDLIFISAYGEEAHRTVSFAHFSDDPETDELPVLRVLGWDDQNSIMHFDRVANRLSSNLRWPGDPDDVETWRQRWSEAFTDRYREAIRSADELIPRLAGLASGLRRRVQDVLEAEAEHGPMRRVFTAVQKMLIHDMDEDGFADMYAQTVAYGLLSASFSRPAGLNAQALVQLTAVCNPFLENLLESLFRLNRGKFHFDVDEVGINDVLDLLRNTNIDAIKAAFNDLNPAEDPVIRFYEGFLRAYDAQQRVKRGVFFTPRPVVSYIVRSVHELLQTEFGLEDGLASIATWADVVKKFPDLQPSKDVKPGDPFVCILDPAVGTATFLHECIEVIERTMKSKWARALRKRDPESQRAWQDSEIVTRWRRYVSEHLLPRLYGFEIMMAPYAIAHLKLTLKLGETGYQFRDGDRLHVYLTNALEPRSELADAQVADLFGPLAREAQDVNRIKRHKRFTVVVGNPPYAGHSANTGDWIQHILRSNLSDGAHGYFEVDGVSLNERNPKWLNDDYVKFIRFAQHAIAEAGTGILGFVTNHSYSDNPTFRGMRQSLMCSFDKGLFVDLHGNIKKAATTEVDENVFDIQQGVAIGLWRRSALHKTKSCINHAEVYGSRSAKYEYLLGHSASNTLGTELNPVSRFYLFVPQAANLRREFSAGWAVNEVFPVNTMGVTTGRDQLCVSFTESEALAKLADFTSNLPEQDLADRYGLSNKSGWNIENARNSVRANGVSASNCQRFGYRPLDNRILYLDTSIVGRARLDVMQHMMGTDNLALCTTRQVNGEFHHVYCARVVTNDCVVSNASGERAYLLPLYLAPDDNGLIPHHEFTPNLAIGFVNAMARCLGSQELLRDFTPEYINSYIYAVLHSPSYRTRYGEVLKIEFPRIPLTCSSNLVRALASLGAELVALHLMESPRLDEHVTEFIGSGAAEVEKVSYSQETVWIDKAKRHGFRPVPLDVWNFHIGGYQVCERWLKDRGPKKGQPGRTLTKDDIAHYQKIVVALKETIRLMAEIDEVIAQHGGWPGAFVTDVDRRDTPNPRQ